MRGAARGACGSCRIGACLQSSESQQALQDCQWCMRAFVAGADRSCSHSGAPDGPMGRRLPRPGCAGAHSTRGPSRVSGVIMAGEWGSMTAALMCACVCVCTADTSGVPVVARLGSSRESLKSRLGFRLWSGHGGPRDRHAFAVDRAGHAPCLVRHRASAIRLVCLCGHVIDDSVWSRNRRLGALARLASSSALLLQRFCPAPTILLSVFIPRHI
jgi:hypothetical protein